MVTLLFSILILNSNHKLRAKYTNHIILDNYENILDQNQKVNLNSIINNNQHFLHYYVAAKIFYDNPIFGSGAKTFRYESQKNRYNDSQDLHGGSTHPHQFHFEILSELGIIGYILIISHLLALLIAQKKRFKFFNCRRNSIYYCNISSLTTFRKFLHQLYGSLFLDKLFFFNWT